VGAKGELLFRLPLQHHHWPPYDVPHALSSQLQAMLASVFVSRYVSLTDAVSLQRTKRGALGVSVSVSPSMLHAPFTTDTQPTIRRPRLTALYFVLLSANSRQPTLHFRPRPGQGLLSGKYCVPERPGRRRERGLGTALRGHPQARKTATQALAQRPQHADTDGGWASFSRQGGSAARASAAPLLAAQPCATATAASLSDVVQRDAAGTAEEGATASQRNHRRSAFTQNLGNGAARGCAWL
jgi:hypothetical protein